MLSQFQAATNTMSAPHTIGAVERNRHEPPPFEGPRARWLVPPIQRRSPHVARSGQGGSLGTTQVFRREAQQAHRDGPKKPGSAVRATLAWSLRPHQRKRVALCRTVRTGPTVQLVGRVSPDGMGRLVLQGVSTCGSVHSCPQCAAAILTTRARELTEALEAHRRERTALVTLTLRHHAGIPLRVLRVLLARAWSEMWGGEWGNDLKRWLGLAGYVRGAEQTWGKNGWHPHLHCLFFFEGEPPSGWVDALAARWETVVRQVYTRLWDTCLACERLDLDGDVPAVHIRTCVCPECLARKVSRVLGAHVLRDGIERLAEHARDFRRGLQRMRGVANVLPNRERGVRAEMCETGAAGKYLAKMGCELSGIMGKSSKPGHYTHWQIAQQAAKGRRWAVRLWEEHAAAMMGARQLTWSRGLRHRLGLEPERPDELLASETVPEPTDIDTPLTEIPAEAWDTIARQQRQLFVASLHTAYHAGTLDVNIWGPSKPVKRAPDPAPVWWNREHEHARKRREGANRYAVASAEADRLELEVATPDETDGCACSLADIKQAWLENDLDRLRRDSAPKVRRAMRPYLSRSERAELREELRDHLLFDGLLSCPF